MAQRHTQFRDEKREKTRQMNQVWFMFDIWWWIPYSVFSDFFFNQGMSVSWYFRFSLQVLNYGAETWDSFVSRRWWEVHPSLLCWTWNFSENFTVRRYNHLGYSFWIYEASKDSFKNCRHADEGPLILYRNTSFAGLVWLRFLWTPWHCCSYGVFCHKCVIMRTADTSGFWVGDTHSWYHNCGCSRKSMPQWRSFQP